MSELAIKRDELVYVGRPYGYFAKVVKVMSEGTMVEVKHFTGENFENEELDIVPADKIRNLDNVGYKEPSAKVEKPKKKRLAFKGKGLKAVKQFDDEALNSVLKDLG